jgi:hypothetical protein
VASSGAAVDVVSSVAARSVLPAGDGDGPCAAVLSDALVEDCAGGLAGAGSDSGFGVSTDGDIDSAAGRVTVGGVCNSVEAAAE